MKEKYTEIIRLVQLEKTKSGYKHSRMDGSGKIDYYRVVSEVYTDYDGYECAKMELYRTVG